MENLVVENLYQSVYKDKRVFITGHTGFKGSWLSLWLSYLGAKVSGYSLPEKTIPSHYDLLQLQVTTYAGDVRNYSDMENALVKAQPDIVFHLAAQSLVRDSYRNPALTYETNVMGTLNVMQALRKVKSVRAFINVTSDKVYENKEWQWPYRENDRLGGFDLYSSSKACSEILTSSFRDSFFNQGSYSINHQLLLASVRTGNVIGGGDWAADRLIPDVVRAMDEGKVAEIRNPSAIRPWEHVLEPLSGYLLLGQKLLEGRKEFATVWNFGPGSSQTLKVAEVLNRIHTYWPEMQWSYQEDSEAMHEANILKLDTSKAQAELQWTPVWGIEETLKYTACWYKDFYKSGKVCSGAHLSEYILKAQQQNCIWAVS